MSRNIPKNSVVLRSSFLLAMKKMEEDQSLGKEQKNILDRNIRAENIAVAFGLDEVKAYMDYNF